MEIGETRILQIIGAATIIAVTVLNYLAHSPLVFIASILGLVMLFYATKKLKKRFNVPLIFIRREGVNYWGGAFGGLIGLLSAFYGSNLGTAALTPSEFGSRLLLFTIYLVLACTLFTGTIMQDIEDGYIGV